MGKAVTEAQARRVLALVEKAFRGYLAEVDESSRPRLVDNYQDGRHRAITWESGSPYEWVYLFPDGGVNEEIVNEVLEFMSRDKAVTVATVAPVTLPAGVRVEVIDACTLGLYPA